VTEPGRYPTKRLDLADKPTLRSAPRRASRAPQSGDARNPPNRRLVPGLIGRLGTGRRRRGALALSAGYVATRRDPRAGVWYPTSRRGCCEHGSLVPSVDDRLEHLLRGTAPTPMRSGRSRDSSAPEQPPPRRRHASRSDGAASTAIKSGTPGASLSPGLPPSARCLARGARTSPLLREIGIEQPQIDAHVIALEPGHPFCISRSSSASRSSRGCSRGSARRSLPPYAAKPRASWPSRADGARRSP
jgi:hypothetical protein